MARINLKNITIQSLLEMTHDDLLALSRKGLNKNKMSEEEFAKARRNQLAEITSRFTSVANRRIKALGKTELGKASPSYIKAKKMSRSGLFTVKGKDWDSLLNTIKESRQFIESKTSTLKGWEDVRHTIEKQLGGAYFNTAYKTRKFWKAYRKLYEKHASEIATKKNKLATKVTSERVQQMLYNTITEHKGGINWKTRLDELLIEAEEEYSKTYSKITGKKDIGSSRIIKEKDED